MGNVETIDGGPLPIDLEHLSQYTANDLEVTREVLRLFIEQMGEMVEDLRWAIEFDVWKRMAHRLKGSCLGVGAGELADLAVAAEGLDALATPEHSDIVERLGVAAERAARYANQLLEDGSFAG